MSGMAARDIVLSCRGVHQSFGANHVLHDLDLEIDRGTIVSLVGPSGCGKSTLLRAIVGTHPTQRGEYRASTGDSGELRPVDGPGRDRGIVYQRYSLFPHLTARENVALGPTLDRTSLPFRTLRPFYWRNLKKKYLAEADAMLERVGLAHALHLYPSEMSGGMCQRVAIAQAIVMKPEILLLDEPFGALDEATREDLQEMLLALNAENIAARRAGTRAPYTILIVTHEIYEAIFVAERVVGLSQYWDWKAAGHAHCPGATIVYDDHAPLILPGEAKDLNALAAQKDEILSAVFAPAPPRDPAARRRFRPEALAFARKQAANG